GAVASGLAFGAIWSLGPLFAAGRGLGTDGSALFLAFALAGGALFMWPIGRLSEVADRRFVLLVTLIVSAVLALLLLLLPMGRSLVLALGFAFGAVALVGYALAAAHAFDRAGAGAE